MKSIFALVLGLISLSPCAVQAFELSSVGTIECTDNASSTLNLFLSTDDAAAQKYVRTKDNIPYDYGRSDMDAQSGLMVLNNDPDSDRGIISLIDNWDPSQPNSLVLNPTTDPSKYNGVLSGQYDTGSSWQPLVNHAMDCTVTFN